MSIKLPPLQLFKGAFKINYSSDVTWVIIYKYLQRVYYAFNKRAKSQQSFDQISNT